MGWKRFYIIIFKHQNLSEEAEFLGLDKTWAVPNAAGAAGGFQHRPYRVFSVLPAEAPGRARPGVSSGSVPAGLRWAPCG